MMPDTTGVEVNDFPPIEADWYELTLTDFEEKTDKNGKLYAKLTFSIGNTKRMAWTNLSYNEKALWKVKQFKIAINANDTDRNLANFKNVRLRGFVKDEEYNGKHYPRVEEFKPYDDQAATPPQNPAADDDLPF